MLYADWAQIKYTARFHLSSDPNDSSGIVSGQKTYTDSDGKTVTVEPNDIVDVVEFYAGETIDLDKAIYNTDLTNPERGSFTFKYWGYYKYSAATTSSSDNSSSEPTTTSTLADTDNTTNTGDTSKSNDDLTGTVYNANPRDTYTDSSVLNFETFDIDNYTFKRYTDSITPMSDIDLFAYWDNSVEVEVTIHHYLVSDDQTTPVEVHEDTTQTVVVNEKSKTETFDALTGLSGTDENGNVVYYFPTKTSDQIIIDLDNKDFEMTFYYTKVTSVTYGTNYWLRAYDSDNNPLYYYDEKTETYKPLYYLGDSNGEVISASNTNSANAYKMSTTSSGINALEVSYEPVDNAKLDDDYKNAITNVSYDPNTDIAISGMSASDTKKAVSVSKVTTNAAVTENAIAIKDSTLVSTSGDIKYYQISKILTAADENVITSDNTIDFYYEKDSNVTFFNIKLYKQVYNISKAGTDDELSYVQVDSDGNISTDVIEVKAVIGAPITYEESPVALAGYRFNKSKSIEVTQGTTEAVVSNKLSTGTLTGNKITDENGITYTTNTDGKDSTISLYFDLATVEVTQTWEESYIDEKSAEFGLYKGTTAANGKTTATLITDDYGNPFTFTISAEEGANNKTLKVYLPVLETINSTTDELETDSSTYYVIWEIGSCNNAVIYSDQVINASNAYNSIGNDSIVLEGSVLTGDSNNSTIQYNDKTTGKVIFSPESDTSNLISGTVYVYNYQTYILPSTGGVGGYLIYILGSVGILSAASMWMFVKRRQTARRCCTRR
jgi:LPXTG-motif cell wall-anchored protein